jgi:hypothetical protein
VNIFQEEDVYEELQAVVSTNFGNADKCMACVAPSASTANKNLETSSLKLFELCYSVLQNEWSQARELDQELSSQLLHISILVLRSITILPHYGRECDEETYYSAMLDMHDMMLEVEVSLARPMSIAAAAA